MSMRSFALTGVVGEDGTLTVKVPDDVPPGPVRVNVLVDDEPLPPDVPPADPPGPATGEGLAGAALPVGR